MNRLALVVLGAALLNVLAASSAAADVEAGETAISVTESAGDGPATPAVSEASAPTVRDCVNMEAFQGSLAAHGFGGPFGWHPEASNDPLAWQACTRISDGEQVGWFTGLDAPVPLTDWVVDTARSQLVVDVPEIATSPPRGGVQLVGVPVWFWLADREPVSTTAAIPGLAATLTATPGTVRVTVSGTGADGVDEAITLDCPDGGRPWTRGRDDPRAASSCSHPFTTNGTFTVDATVTWNLAWTATNGQAGTLPPIERTTTFTLTVQEGQSVTD